MNNFIVSPQFNLYIEGKESAEVKHIYVLFWAGEAYICQGNGPINVAPIKNNKTKTLGVPIN